ncbi:MAG: 50S ribosomal protein L6 [Phycisphaerae bacterium]|jgi:large subunit ribosomal protein L6|nr:50S ribosomal protein L6 [Phycisphaerae bacterium]
MSRLGKKPVAVPDKVKVNITGNTVATEGPKGKLSLVYRPEVDVTFDAENKVVVVSRKDDSREAKSLHGLTRALVANMVEGVLNGYSKTIEIYGTGYGVKQEGQAVALTVGYANVVKLDIPQGVTVTIGVPQAKSNTQPAVFTIAGADKQVIGEYAARIHRVKKTEPYNGKGIRYQGEHIRRKVGKALAGK